jgi:hypothetical protein
MHIHFNHHISCISDIISMILESHPEVTVSASHAREDHGLGGILETVIPEMPANHDGSMPIGYIPWLIETAQAERADIVIPYRHRQVLSACINRFSSCDIRLLTCGNVDVMSMIEDKPRLLSHAERLGLRISPFEEWTTAAGLAGSIKSFMGGKGVHLCVKPATGIYGEGFRILYDEEEQHGARQALRSNQPHVSMQSLQRSISSQGIVPRMMTMPFLPGLERSVDFACLDGVLLAAVTREKHGSVQLVGHDATAVAMAETLTRSLGLSGLANLQTLEDASGRQHLLEVNSRAAGGIGMTIHSGVNLPGILVSALKGAVPGSPVIPEREVRVLRRHVYEVMSEPSE